MLKSMLNLTCFRESYRHVIKTFFLIQAYVFLFSIMLSGLSTALHAQTVILSEDFNVGCKFACSISDWTTPSYVDSLEYYRLSIHKAEWGNGPNNTANAVLNGDQGDHTVWYFTPRFEVVEGYTYRVQRTHKRFRPHGEADQVTVHIGKHPTSAAMTKEVHSQTIPIAFTTQSFDFTASTTGSIHLGFKQTAVGGTDGYSMDDFSISQLKACLPPTEVSQTVLSSTSIQLDWKHDPQHESSTVVIAYKPAAVGVGYGRPGYGRIVTVSGSSYTLTGLTAATDYELSIREQCGHKVTSPAVVLSATTPKKGENLKGLNAAVGSF